MKSFFKKILVAVSLLSIINTQVEAKDLTPPNVQLLGDANGLVHIPEKDLFLHYPNMLPGDSISRTLIIKNNYKYSYEIFLKAKRVSSKEEYDLLDKLDLKITYNDNIIYIGPISGENKLTQDISLGIFKPGQQATLVAQVTLDGPSTGNEYKNKYVQVDWVFTAIKSEESTNQLTNPPTNSQIDNSIDTKPNQEEVVKSPSTGDDGILLHVILGISSILILLITSKKNKK